MHRFVAVPSETLHDVYHTSYFERFQNSLWETHTKISNKQLQKATMFFLKHSTTFETSFFFKKKFKKQRFGTKNNFHKISRSFKNNFLQKKTIFTKFQEVSKTTFNKQNNLKELLKTMYVLTDL